MSVFYYFNFRHQPAALRKFPILLAFLLTYTAQIQYSQLFFVYFLTTPHRPIPYLQRYEANFTVFLQRKCLLEQRERSEYYLLNPEIYL